MKTGSLHRMSLWLCLAVIVSLCTGFAFAADADFDEAHRKAAESHAHESLQLRIKLSKPSYFLGELIPVTFVFEDTKDTKQYEAWMGSYDRSGRIHDLHFVMDGPVGSHVDPLSSYFQDGIFMGGGIGNHVKLGRHEQVFHLNEWVRIDRPGKYRLYATSSRVSQTKDNTSQHVELVSPVIELEIREAKAEELEETFRSAVAASAGASAQRGYEPGIYEALSRLRYLDTETSRRHLRGLLGGEEGAGSLAMFGLIGTRDAKSAVALLDAGITAPDVAVTSSYLNALARLRRSLVKEKETGQPPANAAPGQVATLTYVGSGFDHYGDRADWRKLADAVERKTGRARARSALSLFELLGNDRQQEKYEADAKAKGVRVLGPRTERLDAAIVLPKIRVPLAGEFSRLNPNERERLLSDFWEMVRCPEFTAPLRAMLGAAGNRAEVSFRSGPLSLAMRRLADLEPEEGRKRILEDVRRDHPLYSLEVLCSLPAEEGKKEVPMLAARFAAYERADLEKIAGMIAHYGDASIYDEMRKSYLAREGRWACMIQRDCLAYFIKVRRAEGLDLAFRAMTFRGKEHTHCYSSVAGEVLGPVYGPDVEKRMLAELRKEKDPEVITDMSRVLFQHGSEAVIDPLLDVISRLSPKAEKEDYAYATEAGARLHLIEFMARTASAGRESDEARRWNFSGAQLARLKAFPTSKAERDRFRNYYREN